MQNEISVYVDIIFLENLIIDYVIIDISSRLSGFKAKSWRLFTGATVGALYAVFVCVFSYLLSNMIFSIILKVVISTLMCAVSFGFQNIKKLVVSNVLLYIISFVFAGLFLALKLLGNPVTVDNGGIVVWWGESSVLYVIETLFVGYMVVSIAFRLIRKNRKLSRETIDLELETNGKNVQITALCDTGNELWDSLHNLPVIVCEIESGIELFEETMKQKLIEEFKNGNEDNVYNVMKIFEEMDMADQISVIPYKTVSNGSHLMVGIVGNCILNCEESVCKRQVTICFVGRNLSGTGGYDAIVPPDIFKSE